MSRLHIYNQYWKECKFVCSIFVVTFDQMISLYLEVSSLWIHYNRYLFWGVEMVQLEFSKLF